MPYKKYEPEFRAKVLKEYDASGNRAKVAKANGISSNTILYWQKQAKKASKRQHPKGKRVASRTPKASATDGLQEVIVVAKLIEALKPADRHLLNEWLTAHPLE